VIPMKYLDAEQLKHLMWTPEEGIPDVKKGVKRDAPLDGIRYQLMRTVDTYAFGVHNLRRACLRESNAAHPTFVLDDGSNIYRPLTFRETIEARVNSYEQNTKKRQKLKLYNVWNDSCTGISYQGGTDAFKIIPVCAPLIQIERNCNDLFLPIAYTDFDESELHASVAKYNELLTKEEVENHPAWHVAMGEDVALLRTYRDIVFAELKNPEKAMGFWIRQNTPTDELRTLFVNDLGYISNANGSGNLNDYGSFVRLAPSQKISP